MDTGFGRTRGYGEKGVYNVVFSYMEETVGRFAAKSAVQICEALIAGEEYDLAEDIQEMREFVKRIDWGQVQDLLLKKQKPRNTLDST